MAPKYSKHFVITCAVLFLGWLTNKHYMPVMAEISAPGQITFHGSGFTLPVKITANCPCTIDAIINGKPITLGAGGFFQEEVPVADNIDSGSVQILARVSGGLISHGTVESSKTITYQREESPCRVVEYPKEWGKPEVVVKTACDGIPSGKRTPVHEEQEATFPFDVDYQKETSDVNVVMQLSGYASRTETVTVGNTRYDAKRIQREADAAAREAARLAAEQERQAQEQAAEEAAAAYLKSPAGRRNIFLLALRENGIDESMIVDVDDGGYGIPGLARITVSNLWHIMPYQLRLQAAQNLQEAWEAANPDVLAAHISLVDVNGNEVGARGVFGVWVQKE
ncbi:MAG: hypothetical protein PHO20_00630 [Candidatus Peribacteraceae bacterium]|nr:hypothetical protein [Candidatus Peribacteraceae bacterium]MDD5739257.1 hypothetical protein [Candidatus Peribacteraceae bacterium]